MLDKENDTDLRLCRELARGDWQLFVPGKPRPGDETLMPGIASRADPGDLSAGLKSGVNGRAADSGGVDCVPSAVGKRRRGKSASANNRKPRSSVVVIQSILAVLLIRVRGALHSTF